MVKKNIIRSRKISTLNNANTEANNTRRRIPVRILRSNQVDAITNLAFLLQVEKRKNNYLEAKLKDEVDTKNRRIETLTSTLEREIEHKNYYCDEISTLNNQLNAQNQRISEMNEAILRNRLIALELNQKLRTIGNHFFELDKPCPICFENCTPDSDPILLNCSHYFHFNCLRQHIRTRDDCPSCRTYIREEVLQHSNSDDEVRIADEDEDSSIIERNRRRRLYDILNNDDNELD